MFSRTLLSRQIRQAAAPPSLSAFRLVNQATSTPTLSQVVQRRLLSDQTRQAIDKAVGSAPVVLFMKGTPETPQCGFSRASIQILGLQGVDPAKFAAFNVLEDAELRSGIKEYSDWPTIPQLYVDREFVGGCDILVSMHQNGELAKLLEEKRVLLAADAAAEGESSASSHKTSPEGNIGSDKNPADAKRDAAPEGSTGTAGRSSKE